MPLVSVEGVIDTSPNWPGPVPVIATVSFRPPGPLNVTVPRNMPDAAGWGLTLAVSTTTWPKMLVAVTAVVVVVLAQAACVKPVSTRTASAGPVAPYNAVTRHRMIQLRENTR